MSVITIDNDKSTSKKSSILIELQYFPPISYFRQIVNADILVLEAHENFQKQTFRNRCEILTPNGIESLIIPIEHNKNRCSIQEVRIDYRQRWNLVHERSISSAYGKSPFFDFFFKDFSNILSKKHTFLWDLNLEILAFCLEKLRIKRDINFSKSYLEVLNNDFSDIVDLRNEILPNEYSFYRQSGIVSYQQLFGSNFVKDLSIIDLLFCSVLDSSELLSVKSK